jgi:hypothetical protein
MNNVDLGGHEDPTYTQPDAYTHGTPIAVDGSTMASAYGTSYAQPQPAYAAKGKGKSKARKSRPKPAKTFPDDSPGEPDAGELSPFYRRKGGAPSEPVPVSSAAYAAQQGHAGPAYGVPSQDAAFAPSVSQSAGADPRYVQAQAADAEPRYGQGTTTAAAPRPSSHSWVLTRQQNRQHTQAPKPSLPVQDNTTAMTIAPAREAGYQSPLPKTSQPIQNIMSTMAMPQKREAGLQNPQPPKIHHRRSMTRSITLQLLVRI